MNDDSNDSLSPTYEHLHHQQHQNQIKKEHYSQQLSSISSSSPPINCHSQSHSPSLISSNSIPSTASSSTTIPTVANIHLNENYLQYSTQNSNKNISTLLSQDNMQQQEYNNNNNNNLRSNFTSSSPGLLQNISPNHYLNTNNNHLHSSKRQKHENLTLDVTNKEFSK